jgi:hypothetical protein
VLGWSLTLPTRLSNGCTIAVFPLSPFLTNGVSPSRVRHGPVLSSRTSGLDEFVNLQSLN